MSNARLRRAAYRDAESGHVEPATERPDRPADRWRSHRGARPFTSILLAGLVGTAMAAPAYAAPGDTAVPDSGARPVPAGPIARPGTGGATPVGQPGPPVLGPLALQVINEARAVEALGEQVIQIDQDLAHARDVVTKAKTRLDEASEQLARLRADADTAAAEAYKRATALGPYESYAHRLRQFSVLAPGLEDQPGGARAALQLMRAEEDERAAREAHAEAKTNEAAIAAKHATVRSSFDQRTAALNDLKTRNSAELARIEVQRDQYEQSLGGRNLSTTNIDGMAANPKALAAVDWAVQQVGKQYEWGAEGPETFDCSGLMWAAYKSVGATLPRVANQQYNGTPAITATKVSKGDLLLPGDLVFFASNPADWTSIHHVGMYVGAGRMVHASNTVSDTKVSPVSWSEFFGATRIFPAVPAPKAPVPTPGPQQPGPPPAPPTSAPPPVSSEPPRSTAPPSSSEPPPSGDPSTSAEPSSSAEPSTSPSPSAGVSASTSPSTGTGG